MRRADLRHSVARGNWPISWTSGAPLLKRAVDYRRGTTINRAATRIVASHDPEIVKVEGGYLVDDELVAVSSRHDVRPAGPRR